MVNLRQVALADHVIQRLEREIGIDGAGAVADEQREMMHLARLAASNTRPTCVRVALADQMVMHAGHGEQRRDRRPAVVHAAVGQDDEIAAVGDGVAGQLTDFVHHSFQTGRAFFDRDKGSTTSPT